jgi:pyruvate ferredoxin oxidoreductase alpha subunit
MFPATAGRRTAVVLVHAPGSGRPGAPDADERSAVAGPDAAPLQLHAATCQEALDFVLLAARVASDPRVRLAASVSLGGFDSSTAAPVELPDPEAARCFLASGDAGVAEAVSVGRAAATLDASPAGARYEAHLAAREAELVFEDASLAFARIFGRRHEAVECHRCDGAEVVFCALGSLAVEAIDAVDRLRAESRRVGLVRPRLVRPLPTTALQEALLGRRAVIVLDENVSVGVGGALHADIASALYGAAGAPMLLSVIGNSGLGVDTLCEMVDLAEHALELGVVPPPRLLDARSERSGEVSLREDASNGRGLPVFL